MSYDAKVFRVLIASPSDVIDEREIAVKTIQEWNDLNSPERQIVLLPLRWETHTAPEYGKRPQEVINRQIVDQCDLLIGVFWTRIGSPTGVNDSGTLEEIDRVASSGKPVMLYFSRAKKEPDDIDTEQLLKLREFKKNTYPKALVENYSTQVEFRDKLAKQIEMQLRNLLSSKDSKLSGSITSDILLEFLDIKTRKNIGSSIKLEADFLNISGLDEIPDLLPKTKEKVPKQETQDNEIYIIGGNKGKINKDYYRELTKFVVMQRMFVPIDFWLKNQGTLGAKDLYIDIKVKTDNKDLEILPLDRFNLDRPQKTITDSLFGSNFLAGGFSNLKKVGKGKNEWELTFELKALQPQRKMRSNSILYLGSKKTCNLKLEATIYADSLPKPIRHLLDINLEVKEIKYSAIQLLEDMGEITIVSRKKKRRRSKKS